jgi:hypothetical protein
VFAKANRAIMSATIRKLNEFADVHRTLLLGLVAAGLLFETSVFSATFKKDESEGRILYLIGSWGNAALATFIAMVAAITYWMKPTKPTTSL